MQTTHVDAADGDAGGGCWGLVTACPQKRTCGDTSRTESHADDGTRLAGVGGEGASAWACSAAAREAGADIQPGMHAPAGEGGDVDGGVEASITMLAEAAMASRSVHHQERLSVEQNKELAIAANIGQHKLTDPNPIRTKSH